MPRVVISGQAARRFTGGQTEFEVEANTFRRMVLELDDPQNRRMHDVTAYLWTIK